ncbi:hypothetical protein HG530_007756 [Fusarium avenaceum]|nr:hypothetical protein HG530_007756 [Fusarium avenaceum]
MANLVLKNVDVLGAKELHEVLSANTLAPISSCTTLHTIGEPQRVVVVSFSASGAAAVVTVLVEEATALLGALRNALSIGVSVDVETLSRTLEETLVLDGPANNVDLNLLVREVIIARNPLHPAGVRVLESSSNLCALLSRNRSTRLPSNTDVELAFTSNDLVPAIVLETQGIAPRRVGRPNLDLVMSFLDDSWPETALANKVNPNPRVETFCMDECEFIRVFMIVSIWFFSQTPRAQVISSINLFRAQFPEFGFLHADDLEYREDDLSVVQKLRLLAIVAVSHRYIETNSTETNNRNILFIASETQKRVTSGPSLVLIQTFLILSLCNWGDGDGFNAWMHCGMATRMAQGLLSTGFASCGKRETLSELEKRTLWTCFKMDRLLSCGKRRQAMFPDEEMHFSLPINDTQFLFGQASQPSPLDDSLRSYGPDDHLVLLIQGLRIWSRVHTWIAEGGRRQPGMTEPEQCPFNETSQWHKMKQDLLKWRESQDALMKYPGTKVSVHAQRGQAERFGYINLVYYVSLLFLCREYIPFSPVDEVKPRGPIEPPLLKARGPDEFWSQNTFDLYDAATQISCLLTDLEHVGCPLRTPFSGLCAFSSTLWSIYGSAFPNFMGFSETQTVEANAQAERTMACLVRIGKVWRLAEEWIDVLNTAESIITRS